MIVLRICRYDLLLFPRDLKSGAELPYDMMYRDVKKAKAEVGIMGGKATHAPRGSSARGAKDAGWVSILAMIHNPEPNARLINSACTIFRRRSLLFAG